MESAEISGREALVWSVNVRAIGASKLGGRDVPMFTLMPEA